jgi:hypothetical protein
MNILSLQRQLLHVTVSNSLYAFATGLAGVFVPLIILQTGAPLTHIAALAAWGCLFITPQVQSGYAKRA